MNDMAEPVRDCAFVVVAAGRGERDCAPHEGPKQYRPIGGKAVIRHTLEAILSWSRSGPVVVVIHPDDEGAAGQCRGRHGSAARLTIVHGGPTRQHSVLYGLEALIAQEPRYVFIHDAVRPFVTSSFMDGIAGVLDAGAQAALPALAVPDTLKRAESGRIVATVDRAGLYAAQTPQAFVLCAYPCGAPKGPPRQEIFPLQMMRHCRMGRPRRQPRGRFGGQCQIDGEARYRPRR